MYSDDEKKNNFYEYDDEYEIKEYFKKFSFAMY